MSCQACEEAQINQCEGDSAAYYRWKNANILMNGCEQHLREVMAALRSHDALVAALKFMIAPDGAYSRDKVTYLTNVIEAMRECARAALATAKEE